MCRLCERSWLGMYNTRWGSVHALAGEKFRFTHYPNRALRNNRLKFNKRDKFLRKLLREQWNRGYSRIRRGTYYV